MQLVPCKLSANAAALKADISVTYDGTFIRFAKPGSLMARKYAVADVTSVTLETGADVGRRITATRLATMGAFALAAKKRTGHLFLTISGETDGEGWDKIVEISPKLEARARTFVLSLERAIA